MGIVIAVEIIFDKDHYPHPNEDFMNQQTGTLTAAKTQKATSVSIPKLSKTTIGEELHNHGGEVHSHNTPEDEINEESSSHHAIDLDLKTLLCIADDDIESCTLDLTTEFIKNLFNDEGNLQTEEVGVVLGSVNYNDAVETMVAARIKTESMEREFEYQSEVSEIVHDLAMNNTSVKCGDIACSIQLQNVNNDKFQDFYKRFLANPDKGNIFIAQSYADNGTDLNHRILFFPDSKNAITKRSE